MKYLLLLLLSFNLQALEYELTAKHLVVSQKLFGIIDFKQDALLLGGNVWHDSGFGIGVNVARSTESANNSVKHINPNISITLILVFYRASDIVKIINHIVAILF